MLRCSAIPRPAPSEPAACPKGYACRSDSYLAEPVEGLPNIGVCVPETPEYFGKYKIRHFIIAERELSHTLCIVHSIMKEKTNYGNSQANKYASIK